MKHSPSLPESWPGSYWSRPAISNDQSFFWGWCLSKWFLNSGLACEGVCSFCARRSGFRKLGSKYYLSHIWSIALTSCLQIRTQTTINFDRGNPSPRDCNNSVHCDTGSPWSARCGDVGRQAHIDCCPYTCSYGINPALSSVHSGWPYHIWQMLSSCKGLCCCHWTYYRTRFWPCGSNHRGMPVYSFFTCIGYWFLQKPCWSCAADTLITELETRENSWPLMDTDVRNQITTILYAMTTLSPRMPIVGK